MVSTKVCAEMLHSLYQPQLKACLDCGCCLAGTYRAALINPLEPSDNIGAKKKKKPTIFLNYKYGWRRFITASSQAENFALQ